MKYYFRITSLLMIGFIVGLVCKSSPQELDVVEKAGIIFLFVGFMLLGYFSGREQYKERS